MNEYKKKYYLMMAAVIAGAIFILLFLVLYMNGTFKRKPEMSIVPLNCFEDTLVVVTDQDYAPYSYIDGDGVYQGRDVELIAEIA
ncbi:MAG: transporter substrate-binding domain-containing protein, partial [Lachnospiraceae bacterium]|nr:transporter substrate-binding domain-containing protein [Lachnospiraceae bacterium]